MLATVGEESSMPVRVARARYFACNGLGDGGYDEAWGRIPVGPFTLFFPNTAGRVAAVVRHDLHHVVTGYPTSWRGEGEIGAWEIASGCGSFVAAWILNLQALWIGFLIAPRSMWEAFARGRRANNLYRLAEVEGVLDLELAELQDRLEPRRDVVVSGWDDLLRLVGWWGVASIPNVLIPIGVLRGLWSLLGV
jgi:hypothetical protein